MKPETYSALVAVAAALVDPDATTRAAGALSRVEDWQEIAEQAEIHGLSVMLGRLAAEKLISLPRVFDLQLKALTIRHQKVLAARKVVLAEVIDLYDEHGIQCAFLKGAALSQLIYDPPWLRPMRDIDLLVSSNQALQAQRLLRQVGFSNEDQQTGYLAEHHHLPNSTRIQDGFTISLEVHHDALSGDVEESISLAALDAPLQSYRFAERTAYALGHADMLKHLCHHTFEPADIIKLGSLVDLVRYADFCAESLDWKSFEQAQPKVVNALRCIHALIPLPARLQSKLGVPGPDWQPGGIGHGFQPLSQIAQIADRKNRFRALLSPSEWWMHVFYRVPPGRSLLSTRLVRHPLTVMKWLLRRYRAALKSRSLTAP